MNRRLGYRIQLVEASWPDAVRPGEAQTVAREPSFRLPAELKQSTYDLFVSVGSAIGTPTISLPHDGDDGLRRVRIGQIRVLPPGAPR